MLVFRVEMASVPIGRLQWMKFGVFERAFPETMKLLLTADLHYRLHWFRWLIEQAPELDLICMAGDLLDMFRSESRVEQAREIRTLVKELADVVPVAVCSGNHDHAGRLVSHDRASVYEWFIELGNHRNITPMVQRESSKT